jgi:hypothetical protein
MGAEVLDALDRAKIKVSVALTARLAEYGDWRLVLAGRRFDAVGAREGVGLVFETALAAGIKLDDIPPLLIYRMKDPFVRELRRLFAKTKNVEGMRLGGQLFGAHFIEDAYVYRIR